LGRRRGSGRPLTAAEIRKIAQDQEDDLMRGVGLAGDIALGIAAIGSNLGASGLPPTTDALDDAQRIGWAHYETAPDEASRKQGTDTSQDK